VIEKATGDLLRAGFCDFEHDGSFDSDLEEIREDVPFPGKARGDPDFQTFHRWTGIAWIEVSP